MSKITAINPSDHFPFSHATIHNGIVYVSGQVGFRSGTTEVVSADIHDQCRRTFQNIDDILSAAGTSNQHIIRCGVYLKHIAEHFASFNECYAEWLGGHRPSRSAIQTSFALPDILVEVDCIAAVD